MIFVFQNCLRLQILKFQITLIDSLEQLIHSHQLRNALVKNRQFFEGLLTSKMRPEKGLFSLRSLGCALPASISPSSVFGGVFIVHKVLSKYQVVMMTEKESPPHSQSSENLQHHLIWQYENNRSIASNWHYFFLTAYIFVGVVALLANGLVVVAVYRNKKVSKNSIFFIKMHLLSKNWNFGQKKIL